MSPERIQKKMKITKLAALTLALAPLSLTFAAPAHATSSVAVDLPNDKVAGGETVPVAVFLTGFSFASLNVDLVVNSGTLTVTDPNSDLVLNPGFSSLSDQTEISIHGTKSHVVNIMENGVTWTAPGDSSTMTTLGLKIQVGEAKTGTTYDPVTGHTYQYVSNPLSWSAAKTAANAMTFEGEHGYLANITSAEENTFVATKSGAADVWIGATDDQTYVNAALTAAGKPTISYDPQIIGEYYWGDGPEVGTNFSTTLESPTAVDGLFSSWANTEPNNWSEIEGCAVTNWDGVMGDWNDLECARTNPYLVEFNTTPAEFSTTVVTFDNITGTDPDAIPAGAIKDKGTGLADTGFDGTLPLTLALLLLVAGSTSFVVAKLKK